MTAPPSFRDVLAAGPRVVSRYTGTLFAVFLVQALLAGACILAIALVLAQTFAHLPMWDEAVDGDLVALIHCLQYGRASFLATFGIMFGAIVVWQLVSWFLAGGIYGVLAHRPEGRGAVARCFGGSGASTYFAYARLAVIQLPAWSFVLFVLGTGLGIAAPRVEHALTIPELIGPLILASLPAIVLLHFFWTVSDYARIELALRSDSQDPGDSPTIGANHPHGAPADVVAPGVLVTYVRTLAYVVRNPMTLLHGALGWVLFILVTLAYAYLANGHPMYGADGAVMLFVARHGVALLRLVIRFGVMGGQVELGRSRPLPPRPVAAKPAAA